MTQGPHCSLFPNHYETKYTIVSLRMISISYSSHTHYKTVLNWTMLMTYYKESYISARRIKNQHCSPNLDLIILGLGVNGDKIKGFGQGQT